MRNFVFSVISLNEVLTLEAWSGYHVPLNKLLFLYIH